MEPLDLELDGQPTPVLAGLDRQRHTTPPRASLRRGASASTTASSTSASCSANAAGRAPGSSSTCSRDVSRRFAVYREDRVASAIDHATTARCAWQTTARRSTDRRASPSPSSAGPWPWLCRPPRRPSAPIRLREPGNPAGRHRSGPRRSRRVLARRNGRQQLPAGTERIEYNKRRRQTRLRDAQKTPSTVCERCPEPEHRSHRSRRTSSAGSIGVRARVAFVRSAGVHPGAAGVDAPEVSGANPQARSRRGRRPPWTPRQSTRPRPASRRPRRPVLRRHRS